MNSVVTQKDPQPSRRQMTGKVATANASASVSSDPDKGGGRSHVPQPGWSSVLGGAPGDTKENCGDPSTTWVPTAGMQATFKWVNTTSKGA